MLIKCCWAVVFGGLAGWPLPHLCPLGALKHRPALPGSPQDGSVPEAEGGFKALLVVASVNTSQKKSLQNRQPQKMVGTATRVGELKVATVTRTW